MISLDFYQQVMSMTDEFRRQFAMISSLPNVEEKLKKYAVKKNGRAIESYEEKLKYFIYADVTCCYVSIKDVLDWNSNETFSLLALIARLENCHPLQYENLDEQICSVQKAYKSLLQVLYNFSTNHKGKLSFFVPRVIDAKFGKECNDYMECLTLFTTIVAMADGVVTEQENDFVKQISGEKLRVLGTKELEMWRRKLNEEEQNLKKYGVDKVFLDVALYGYNRCGVNVYDLHEYLNIDYHSISCAITKMEELGLIDSRGRARCNIAEVIEQMKKGTYVLPYQHSNDNVGSDCNSFSEK